MAILMLLSIIVMDIASDAVDFPWWAYLIVCLAYLGIEAIDFIADL